MILTLWSKEYLKIAIHAGLYNYNSKIAFGSKEYLKIAMDLICIHIGLHNNNNNIVV